MNAPRLIDTSAEVEQEQWARIRALSPAERLARALALSALGRELAWAGARRLAGAAGPDAVRRRYLEQAYGVDTAGWVVRLIAAEPAA